MRMSHDDAELMRRWRHGDAGAFEALVRHWQQPIARFLSRLVGQPEQVQDLCQEVFLRLHLAGQRYRETGTFSAWLYRIALNVARDAGKRRRLPLQPLPVDGPCDPMGSAADVCEQEELATVVNNAVAALPPLLREVVVLRHTDGINFEHMARILKTPATTLRSRFAVALGRLRERLVQLGLSTEEVDQ